ncbi:MAG: peptide-binding protein [Candidatus Omnitrophica bacterium]|nr:peptide-binding protein [Candidatus Omnitrophota bacterium]
MKNKIPCFAVFFLFCLTFGACTNTLQEKPPESKDSGIAAHGDTIIEAGIGDARTLVPILASDSASGQICSMIFNGLVKYDKDLILIGDLAESWTVEENGLVIIFHLRKNVRWHDGALFSAEDVEFTYKALINPQVRTPYSGDFQKVENMEIIDPFTIKVTYKEAFSPGLSSWGMNIMPKHILENEDLNNSAFGRRPIGTGPYKFKEWKTQEFVVLEANDDYFEGRPYIDKYILKVIPDPATMFLELQSRGIDSMGLTSLQYARQTDSPFFKREYQKFRYQGFSYTYMGYNLLDEKFSDVRVRRAINHAVNKKELIDGILLGLGTECTGPFAARSWAYNNDVRSALYEPVKALELMKEAGWVPNKDGILQKNGQIFEFTIITNQGNEERKYAAQIIQRRLQKIGMKVKIKVVEWSAFINEFVNKRNFEAILMGWSLSLDPDMYDIWHSSKTKQGEFNFVGYSNKEVDNLLSKGRSEFDQAKRKVIYHRIHELIYNDQPYLFLYNPDNLPILSSRIKGIKPAPAGISYNFIKWYVPRSQQRYLEK